MPSRHGTQPHCPSAQNLTVGMGKINAKKRLAKQLEEEKKEKLLQRAVRAVERAQYPLIRKAAEAFGVHYSTLSCRLKGKIQFSNCDSA